MQVVFHAVAAEHAAHLDNYDSCRTTIQSLGDSEVELLSSLVASVVENQFANRPEFKPAMSFIESIGREMKAAHRLSRGLAPLFRFLHRQLAAPKTFRAWPVADPGHWPFGRSDSAMRNNRSVEGCVLGYNRMRSSPRSNHHAFGLVYLWWRLRA